MNAISGHRHGAVEQARLVHTPALLLVELRGRSFLDAVIAAIEADPSTLLHQAVFAWGNTAEQLVRIALSEAGHAG